MFQLSVIQGPDTGKRVPCEQYPLIVGRGTGIAMTLTDSRVSRRHCEITASQDRLILRDLKSGNGTTLNGRLVEEAELQPGDRIRIGDSVLLLETTDPQLTSPVPVAGDITRIVVRPDPHDASAVLHRVPLEEGNRILAAPESRSTDWLRSRLANLTVLYETTTAISAILDVDLMLNRILELVLATTEADHGCILVRDLESGELLPKAIQSRSSRGPAEFVVSRTVVDYVLREQVGVLVSDAGADDRFRQGESVARHQLREVICVPMKGRREVVGVLFLDTHAGAGQAVRLTEDHLRLTVAVAHQAALALEETRYYQAMLQAERLAAVGQTIAALSHHIKNIMQGVRFGSDMLRAGLEDHDDDLIRKGWRLVEKNQHKIDDLILDMLNYSKEREPLLGEVDLVSVVQEVLEMVRGRIEELGVTLHWQPGSLPPILCDAEGIQRAVLNIVSNALDALQDADQRELRVELLLSASAVEIRVEDSGPGIPTEKLEEIFKPFVSSKGSRGTGLGLPASRKTLREHGGDVIAENRSEGGARMVIRLPRGSAR